MSEKQGPDKTIILHIGLHKTGTSSIQATLKHNQGVLRGRGVLYPGFLPPNHSQFFINAFSERAEHYHANRRQGLDAAAIAERASEQMDRLGRALSRFDGPTVLLSGEDACTLQAPEVTQVRSRLDALAGSVGVNTAYRVLLYTRNPAAFVSSAMQENVKGNGMRLEDSRELHIRNAAGRYRRIHEAWVSAFGENAVEFRCFETACKAPGGLIGDFLGSIGLADDGIEHQLSNEGISDEVTQFLSSLYLPGSGAGHGRLQDCQTRIDLTPQDRDTLFALRGSKGDLLSLDDQIRTWDVVADDMRFLQSRFGITYERPEAGRIAPNGKFGPDFLHDLALALPRLSAPTCEALLHYLLTRPVDPHSSTDTTGAGIT